MCTPLFSSLLKQTLTFSQTQIHLLHQSLHFLHFLSGGCLCSTDGQNGGNGAVCLQCVSPLMDFQNNLFVGLKRLRDKFHYNKADVSLWALNERQKQQNNPKNSAEGNK